jgi:hypothetical protein
MHEPAYNRFPSSAHLGSVLIQLLSAWALGPEPSEGQVAAVELRPHCSLCIRSSRATLVSSQSYMLRGSYQDSCLEN